MGCRFCPALEGQTGRHDVCTILRSVRNGIYEVFYFKNTQPITILATLCQMIPHFPLGALDCLQVKLARSFYHASKHWGVRLQVCLIRKSLSMKLAKSELGISTWDESSISIIVFSRRISVLFIFITILLQLLHPLF